MQKISKLALALTLAILMGLFILATALWSAISLNSGGSFGQAFMQAYQSVHPSSFSYQQPLAYVLVNTGYAIMDGFIAGFLIAVLYNWLAGRFVSREVTEQSAEGSPGEDQT